MQFLKPLSLRPLVREHFSAFFHHCQQGENVEDEKLDRKTSAAEFYLSLNDDENEC